VIGLRKARIPADLRPRLPQGDESACRADLGLLRD